MIEITVKEGDSTQRADKFITKLLPGASKSLIYKQIRKKNITLNGKKMDGSEKLIKNDKIQFFFSKETFDKFSIASDIEYYERLITKSIDAYKSIKGVDIVYEDDNILIFGKPFGILSQNDDSDSYSLNDYLIGYLAAKGLGASELSHFKPSVLNRLDRNTSGMVLCSKTLLGANAISALLRDRTMHKYYLTYVAGNMSGSERLTGFHYKDTANNKVTIKDKLIDSDNPDDFDEIVTGYRVLGNYHDSVLNDYSLLEIELITGKSHQIRAHLSHIGHPLLGDPKYGDDALNKEVNKLGINGQMLHAYRLVMPGDLPEGLNNLENKEFTLRAPKNWSVLDGYMEE